jgi:hypothetical protein
MVDSELVKVCQLLSNFCGGVNADPSVADVFVPRRF